MVTVELSIQAKNGKHMTKEIACLRPHPGDDILCDEEVFCVRAVALQAGENKVLAQVTHDRGKRLSQRTLAGMGFSLIGD